MSLTFFKTVLVSLQNRIFLKPAWELIGRIIFDFDKVNDLADWARKEFREIFLDNLSKFYEFIVSNPKCGTRNKIFEMLNTYKKVNSMGRFANNNNGKKQLKDLDLRGLNSYKIDSNSL